MLSVSDIYDTTKISQQIHRTLLRLPTDTDTDTSRPRYKHFLSKDL